MLPIALPLHKAASMPVISPKPRKELRTFLCEREEQCADSATPLRDRLGYDDTG